MNPTPRLRLLALALPLLFLVPSAPAQTAPSPVFALVSIKPIDPHQGPIDLSGAPPDVQPGGQYRNPVAVLPQLIAFAYDLKQPNITLIGVPNLGPGSVYSIEAKPADGFPNLPPDQNTEQVRLMVRALLVDRFKLAVHRETRQLPVYRLVLAKGGLKAEIKPVPAPAPDSAAAARPVGGAWGNSSGHFIGHAATLDGFADLLSAILKRPVSNQTGLDGHYDYNVSWHTPDYDPAVPSAPGFNADGTALLISTLEQRFGLRLVAATAPVEVLVVDHAEKPVIE